jgi:hypothetical protein
MLVLLTLRSHCCPVLLASATVFLPLTFTGTLLVQSSFSWFAPRQIHALYRPAVLALGKAKGLGSLHAVDGLKRQTPRYFLPNT